MKVKIQATGKYYLASKLNAMTFLHFISILLLLLYLFVPVSSYSQDFTATTLGDYGNITVMKVTGNYDAKNSDDTINFIPRVTIAKEFFKTHKDEYDFLVIYSNFDFQMPDAEAAAYYLTVKNDTTGIGQQIFDNSEMFGSSGKLQGTIDMGNVLNMDTSLLEPGFETTLDILSHEVLHRWGAHVKFRDAAGQIDTSLLGKNNDHWSFLLDTDGSLLYGNDWQDNGDGTFTSIASGKYYSPLDMYLMGFYDKSQVPPMLLIDNADVDPARSSETGVTISGTPRYISIDDIIAAEGERIPGPSTSQKTFKSAFIFITTPNTFAEYEIYGLETIRNEWVTRFSILTDGHGLMQVALAPKGNVPSNPGVLPPTVTPRTLPPDINDGVTWLVNNQQADGSWLDLSHTVQRDTATTVFALKNFDSAQQYYASGLEWLNESTSANLDYLSRKIEAIAGSGADTVDLLGELLVKQNTDGGWGCNKGYLSNPLDASLALKALAEAGYSEADVIADTIEYLKTKQNTDGGWGSGDENSTIQSTANVLEAFNNYKTDYQLDDQIDTGIAWLLSKQNPDGGFGNSPSTVYDTAVATLALREFNVSSDVTNNAMNYILDQQSDDGSWYESPYQTALAVSAVWKASVDPDLSVRIEDIYIIPSTISSLPANVVINTDLWNSGKTDVPQAKVVLYDGAIAEQNKIGEQMLAFPGESSVTVTFSTIITDGEGHHFTVVLDPDNVIEESSEANNTAGKTLSPQTTYDFEATDISVSTDPADIFQDVVISSRITNRGTLNAYNVQLQYYIDEVEGPFDIATETVDIPAGATINNEIVWTTSRAGENLALTVKADPFNTFAELAEENNTVSTYITVDDLDLTDPNITISFKDIVVTPNPVNYHGSVSISATVRNEGFSGASDIKVDFYKGVPGEGGEPLGTQTISSLAVSESATVSVDWTNITETGDRIIYVKVDPDNLISEISEDDNDAFTTLGILSLPDFIVSAESFVFSPSVVKEGDIVSINVTVLNTGDQEAYNISVAAYEGSDLIGRKDIPYIPGNYQDIVSFDYDTTGKTGQHEITIIVDPDNAITEQSEENNTASGSFIIQESSLLLTETYISPNGDGVKDSTEFSFRLDVPQTVKVIVVNEHGGIVRTFSGGEFENTTGGVITWDGLDDKGVVVNDGQYGIKIVDSNSNIIKSLLVIVDNNRSPISDAAGTKFSLENEVLSGMSNHYVNWQWFPDESGILFRTDSSSSYMPDYPAGLYVSSPDGKDKTRIVPWEWRNEFDPRYGFVYYLPAISPNGEKVAFFLTKYDWEIGSILSQLWIVDRDGRNLTLLDSYEKTYYGSSYFGVGDIKWSPDGEYISYKVYKSNDELNIIRKDGTGKITIESTYNYIGIYNWSPDSSRIVYEFSNDFIKVYDISGNELDIIEEVNGVYTIEWLDNQKLFVVHEASESYYRQGVLIIDTTGNGNNEQLVDNVKVQVHGPSEKYMHTSPNGQLSTFVVYDDDTGESRIYTIDVSGNSDIVYTFEGLDGQGCTWPIYFSLVWSPDSSKIAFPLDGGECFGRDDETGLYYEDKIIVLDLTTKTTTSFASPIQRHTNLARWLPDSASVAASCNGYNECNDIYLFDTRTGESIPVVTGLMRTYPYYSNDGGMHSPKSGLVSPLGNYLMYGQRVNDSSSLWAISSLLNLRTELNASRDVSAIVLSGIAEDLNFEGYMLEYADINIPDKWDLITPPKEVPVVNGNFASWVPPYEGNFYVKLTVWDKAGNEATDTKMVSWGQSSVITGLYKTHEIFSPNSDGSKDNVEIHYNVNQAVNLEFNFFNEDNTLIRSIEKNHLSPASDFIIWDGRDSSGKIVSYGRYRIKVLSNDLYVDVDTVPPDVNLELNQLQQDPETSEIYTDISGYAVDLKIRNWTVEYGEGENPQEWYQLIQGSELLVKKDEYGKLLLDPVENDTVLTYGGSDIEWLVDTKFKITAEDFGGNRNSYISDFAPEQIVFYRWDNLIFPVDEGVIYDKFGVHSIGMKETIREQITSLTVQYEENEAWFDSHTVTYPASGDLELTWDSSDLNPNYDGHNIRIKAVNISGNEYYSNSLHLTKEPKFTLKLICEENKYLRAVNDLKEDLVDLHFQVAIGLSTDWTDFSVYDSSSGDIIPEGAFNLELPDMMDGLVYNMRMTGTGTSGEIYESNLAGNLCNNAIELEVDPHNEGCNTLSTQAGISVRVSNRQWFNNNTANAKLEIYISGLEGSELLYQAGQADLITNDWGAQTVINTADMPEGSYSINAFLTYLDVSENKNIVSSDSDTLLVDRVLPTSLITSPDESVKVCPTKMGGWYGVPVEGIAAANNSVKEYELYQSSCESGAYWCPAKTRESEVEVPISGTGPVNGIIDVWDVTGISISDPSLQLRVVDKAGNMTCHDTAISLDTIVVSEISVDKDLFSPNGDGISDDLEIYYNADEYVSVDINIFRLNRNAGGSYTPDPAPLRTFNAGLDTGLNSIIWDGKDGAGTVVPEGKYKISILSKDVCDNTKSRWFAVEIDNTPPTAIITYPTPDDPVGNIIEVKGTADDINFLNYNLDAGLGESPEQWTFIASKTAHVINNILDVWNTSELSGLWTLRMTASDKAGNKTETAVLVDLDNRVNNNFIRDLSIDPEVFSPNNDGKVDTASIEYELGDTCSLTIKITDASGFVHKTHSPGSSPAGTYTYVWNGANDAGVTVPEGQYSILLSATLPSDSTIIQNETITVIVDTTPPVIEINQPLPDSYISTDVVVSGMIYDETLSEYTITYAGDPGSVIVDSGNQSREDFTFGILNDLAEGVYTLTAFAKDLGENTTEMNMIFTTDRTAPVVTLTDPEEGEFFGSDRDTVDIAGSIEDEHLELYSLRYGMGDNPADWTILLTDENVPVDPQLYNWNVGNDSGLQDGIYTISLYARDTSGLDSEARVKISIDNSPPEVAITDPPEGDYIREAFDIKGSVQDLNIEEYIVEISPGTCSDASQWSLIKRAFVPVHNGVLATWQALPDDGEFCIRLTATDKFGNSEETKIGVKVDTYPPAPPELSGSLQDDSGASLNWTQNTEPDFAGYNLYRNNYKINNELITYISYVDQELSEGTYTYIVKAVDLAGWESEPSNEVKIAIDLTGPQVSISSPKGNSNVSGFIGIKGTAYSVDDFKEYRVFIGQGLNPTSWNLIRTSPVPTPYGELAQLDTVTLGEGGTYSIKLEAEDINGNINIDQISVIIDNEPPLAPVLISAVPDNANVTVTWLANTEPDLAGYLLYRNDRLVNASGTVIENLKVYLINGTTYLDKDLPDGTSEYFLYAMDEAGNISDQSNTLEVSIDLNAPQAVIVDPSDGSEFEHNILVVAESADLDIASIQFQYKRAEDTVWTDVGSAILTQPYFTFLDPVSLGFSYGEYNLRAVATDMGGRTDPSPSNIYVTYTDLTAPETPYDLSALTTGQDVALTWTANSDVDDFAGYYVYRTFDGNRERITSSPLSDTTYTDSGLPDGTYIYDVVSVDTYDNESIPSNSVKGIVYAPEIEQPYTPTGESAIQIIGSSVEVDSSIDIFIDTGSGPILFSTYTPDAEGNFTFDLSLSLGDNRITAVASDNNGNISRTSDELVVVYNEPPSAPTGLTSSVEGFDVTLSWNPVTEPDSEPDLPGYNIYRNGEKLNQTSALTTGTAYASSSYSSSYHPSKAVDSNPYSYWMSPYGYGTFTTSWWRLDFSSPELINHIDIQWYSDPYTAKDYELQAWSGHAWITLAKVEGNTEKENTFDFSPPYRTDKIRLYITDTNDTNSSSVVQLSNVSITKDNLITGTSYNDLNLDDGQYSYEVTAVDYYGYESLPSDKVETVVGDVNPPAAPQNLTATASASDIGLSWDANIEPDLAGYNVYRDVSGEWIKINAALVTGNDDADSDLPNDTYTYRVTAVDAAGNESPPSNEASATINIVPPLPPVSLSVSSVSEGGVLSVSWEYTGPASGYNLYRSTISGGPYTRINESLISENLYLDTGLTSGTAYYYVVVSVDNIGNESIYSNEAMGTPADTDADQPLIFFPALSGSAVTLYNDRTDVAGIADTGTYVEVFVNGISQGLVRALEQDEHSAWSFENTNGYGLDLSANGHKVVYSDSNKNIHIKSLDSGTEINTGQEGEYPKWSPDGKRILFQTKDNSRIMIYEIDSGTAMPLTGDSYYEYKAVWSPDGDRVVFHSDRNGTTELWIKDLITGDLLQITNTGFAVKPKWSPDGKRIAYAGYPSNIYSVHIETEEIVEIGSGIYYSDTYEWSPDGKSIVYTKNNSIWVTDIETHETKLLTPAGSSEKQPVWSPDGSSILLTKWDSTLYKYTLVLRDPVTATDITITHEGLNSSPIEIIWGKSGRIVHSESNVLNLIDVKGTFNLNDTQLREGKNTITAVAIDENENQSPPSEEVIVIFDQSLLPDIVTNEHDIYIYPMYPLVGDEVAFNIDVRNIGKTEAQDIEVDLYIWNSAGNLELVKSDTVPYIASESSESIGFSWDSTGKLGINTVIVVIDPEEKITESSEANNYTTRDFVVLEEEGLSMTTTLDADQYGSNQDANIQISLINIGVMRDVVLDVRVEDTNGYEVASFETINTHIAYGENEDYSLVWNTGTTYAGPYQVHTILKNTPEIIAEDIIPFDILADVDTGLTTATDKTHYDANEDVTVSFNVINDSINYIIPELTATVRITDFDGNEKFTDSKTLADLLPGSSNALASVWNTGLNAPGLYTAVVEINSYSEIVASSSAQFSINESLILTGEISVTPAIVALGNTVRADYTVQNNGNADVNSLILNIIVADPETQATVAMVENTIDLTEGNAYTGEHVFSTAGYDLKTYALSLQYVHDGNTGNAASTSFRVKDGTPPDVSLISPATGNTYNSAFNITAISSDNASGVDRVEYMLDNDPWKLLPPSDPSVGRYSITWSPEISDQGAHTVYVRATDNAGNTSEPVSVTFTIEMIRIDAEDQIVNTDEDIASAITLTASGTWTGTPVFSVVTNPAHGTLSGTPPALTYTPDLNFNGEDSFTFMAAVGSHESNVATVNITVNPVNDAPEGVDDAVETDEDTSVSIAVTTNDSDVEDDTLTVTNTTEPANGTVVINADQTVTYTPNLNFNGTDSFTYTIDDGNGGQGTATVTVTVNAVNDPPESADDEASTDEDNSVTIGVTGNDNGGPADEDQTLTVQTVTQGANGIVINNFDGTITYIPDPDYYGPDSFEYTINDSEGLADTATVVIDVLLVNDPPEVLISQETQDVQYSDGITPVTITARDIDSSALTVTVDLLEGLQISSEVCTDTEGIWTCTWILEGQVLAGAGIYDIPITISDGEFEVADYATLNVSQEDADIAFDDKNPVSVRVATTGGNSGVFNLTLHVTEALPDHPEISAFPGDISLAEVSMSLVPVGPGSPVQGVCIPGSVSGSGYDAVKTVICSFDDVPVNTYTADVNVEGGFYHGHGEDVLVVYDPGLGFTTGGGWFYWPGTEDPDNGYLGDKTNFGFTMKYNKNGENIKGSLLLISHLPDGTIYRIKSNALYGLALGEMVVNGENIGWASFSGKATYKEPDWLEPVGNHEFIVYIEDRNEPGTGDDRIWIELKDKNRDVINDISMPAPAADNAEYIQGGNLVAPH